MYNTNQDLKPLMTSMIQPQILANHVRIHDRTNMRGMPLSTSIAAAQELSAKEGTLTQLWFNIRSTSQMVLPNIY